MKEQNKVGREKNKARKENGFLQMCRWNDVKVKISA